jgi:RNA polymerase sigma factor (TIGR02999 family)
MESEFTCMLQEARAGNGDAANRVFELILEDLLQVARRMMKNERPDHTLQASALVNEACLKLIDQNVIAVAESRRYLFMAANRAMQQILVDHARSRNAQKRGGDRQRVPIDTLLDNFETENGVAFEELHLALEELGKENARQRELVEHRYFGGLSIEETAVMMDISPATAKRDWTLARAKLYAAIKHDSEQV